MDVGPEQHEKSGPTAGERAFPTAGKSTCKRTSRAESTAGKELYTEDWLRQIARVDPRSGRAQPRYEAGPNGDPGQGPGHSDFQQTVSPSSVVDTLKHCSNQLEELP